MGTRAAWTQAMFDHLDLHGTATLDELLTVGARAVPPGRALHQRERTNRSRRERAYAGGGTAGPRPDRDTDRAIRTGARRVAYDSLNVQLVAGHILRDGDVLWRRP